MKQKSIRTSSLRQAMIVAMQDRHLASHTIEAYVHWVEQLARHYWRCPSKISIDETNRFLLHLIRERNLAWSTVNQALCGIRFFVLHVLGVEQPGLWIPPRKREQRLPEVLTRSEALRLIKRPLNGSPECMTSI